MSFKSVVLGASAHKSYTHNMSFDNNTTMDFGVLQPLLSQYMEPNSEIKVNARQLVRLAPMPTPSFARMWLCNYARFVLMTDVVPYFESLLSGIPFTGPKSTYTPTELPYTDNKVLQLYLCMRSEITVYSRPNRDAEYSLFNLSASSDYDKALLAFIKHFDVSSVSLLNDAFSYTDPFYKSMHLGVFVTPESSDYIVHVKPEPSSSVEYLYCIRYSNVAKRIRKQLIGLGYSLCASDTSHLSIAPLLAYYKAYFNYFGLTRDIQFETTNCYGIIMEVWNYFTDFSSTMFNSSDNISPQFFSFLEDLGNLYYTDGNSYIASHRVKISNNASLPGVSSAYLSNTNSTNISMQSNGLPIQRGNSFTQLTLDVLKRLSVYVAKDSVIGRRISDWVKVHYGADVSFSLFKDSYNVSEWRTPINIDDVFSTSETANIGNEKKGDYLGSYAGKGIGFGKESFNFKSPSKHGFLFVMSCIVPQSNIFQGNDPTLYAIDNDTIPHPEFDALGYEITPTSAILPDNFISDGQSSFNWSSDSFGFVPRYTGFKMKKNIVNGDMCCGYYKRDFLPYFNDRIILNNSLVLTPNSSDTKKFKLNIANNVAPRASTSWQQICKYGFLSNFNRLFYNSGDVYPTSDNELINDNFICQTVFDVRLKNWMKPVQNSYETVDEVDNSTVSVSSN